MEEFIGQAVTDGDSGVEAADTGESGAREGEGSARDGTVGVAQYVVFTL